VLPPKWGVAMKLGRVRSLCSAVGGVDKSITGGGHQLPGNQDVVQVVLSDDRPSCRVDEHGAGLKWSKSFPEIIFSVFFTRGH